MRFIEENVVSLENQMKRQFFFEKNGYLQRYFSFLVFIGMITVPFTSSLLETLMLDC